MRFGLPQLTAAALVATGLASFGASSVQAQVYVNAPAATYYRPSTVVVQRSNIVRTPVYGAPVYATPVYARVPAVTVVRPAGGYVIRNPRYIRNRPFAPRYYGVPY